MVDSPVVDSSVVNSPVAVVGVGAAVGSVGLCFALFTMSSRVGIGSTQH